MRLRNKQTGEMGDLIIDKALLVVRTGTAWLHYSSLAELNSEWEDYEEPKPQVVYYIDRDGRIVPYKNIEYPKRIFNAEQNKEIGNYFETEEEAEKAVEKLKAWKRLKDGGFVFCGKGDCLDTIKFDYGPAGYNRQDFNLLFGGGE